MKLGRIGERAWLAIACAAGVSASAEQSFDTALKRILQASKDRFTPIEGARIENRRRDSFFEPRVYLPGATYCRIFETERIWVFGCEWEQTASPKAFGGLYDRLVANVSTTLGPEWNKQSGTRKSWQENLFTAGNRPTIQLILQARPPVIHLFVLPAGAPNKGLSVLPDWHAFFHP